MLRGSVNDRSPPNEKITLFRSLFRGREDVYPRRFESVPQGKPVTRLFAAMSGCLGSAKNRESSVRIANIARFFLSRTM